MEHRTSLSQSSHYYYLWRAAWGRSFSKQIFIIKARIRFQTGRKRRKETFPSAHSLLTFFEIKHLWKGRLAGTPPSRTAAARRAQGAFASHLQQQVRSSDPRRRQLRCPGPGRLGCSQHLPLCQSLPGPGDTDIRAPCALRSPLVLPSHTLALSPAPVHRQRQGC